MAQLIIALDVADHHKAVALALQLRGIAPWCKVGMELFTAAGPGLLAALTNMGFKVFLDLKFYDIPHTVGQAVKSAAGVGVDMLTLHCQGGQRMCEAARDAVEGLSERRPLLFGVTVLTSFMQGEMPGIDRKPAEYAAFLAAKGAHWGLDGIVCSGHEAKSIKASCPTLRCLCPGIRPAGAGNDDQRRVMTPAEAIAAGADYLVIGRPVTLAADPAQAARAICAEMASAETVQA